MKHDRDIELCRRYLAGTNLDDLHADFHISKERIRQILRKHGVYKKGHHRAKSSRHNFLGITISDEDKTRLKAEADKRGMSMSSLTADMIREKLGKVAS